MSTAFFFILRQKVERRIEWIEGVSIQVADHVDGAVALKSVDSACVCTHLQCLIVVVR